MQPSDILQYALRSLRRRQLRSWLTILGIVVGITAIVLLIGLVQGLKEDVESQLSGFGSRTIIAIPINVQSANNIGASSFLPTSGKMYQKDVERLKRLPEIEHIAAVITGRTYVIFHGKQVTASVTGVDPDIYLQTAGTLEIEKGRFLTNVDRRSLVLGNDVAKDSFDEMVDVSSNVQIENISYRVVGILKKRGSSFTNTDSAIFVPLEEARELFSNTLVEHEVSAIRMNVRSDADPVKVGEEIERELLMSHHVTSDKKDFSIITAEFINNQLNQVTGILSLFLGSIAGISLLVGGIGIANTMFMSVTERRREIGVLKSIGAKKSDILSLFLTESLIIGVVGGVLGLVGAYVISFLIKVAAGVNISVLPVVVAGSVFFSGLVGIISGVFPAKKAAELDPVQVLS